MKPQIFLPASLLIFCFFLFTNTVFAAGKKKIITAENSVAGQIEIIPVKNIADRGTSPLQNGRPAKDQKKEKDSVPSHETHKKGHSEEDGKHHHFHMHRAKKVKRFCSLICFLAKLLLVITHICILIYVFSHSVSH